MNEFSKIKLPSGTYTVKDSSARDTSNSALSKATQNESDITTLKGKVDTNTTNISNLTNRVTKNEGDIAKQIDWNTLPQNVEKVKEYIPEISMMFVYAHPEKLDLVKTKLTPVLGEKKLIIVNEQSLNNSQRKLLEAIGR